jgi:nucleoside-diphosphate-sugar epimerase
MIQSHPAMTELVNSEGTKRLLRDFNAKDVLFVSTVKVHGDCERVQPYISGKRSGEQACMEAGAKVARLGNVYGPGMAADDSRVVPVFIRRALSGEPLSLWNGGEQTDSFCYVSDIVRGLIAFMDSDETGVMEMGNPEATSIRELADLVISLTGSSSRIITNENVLVAEECHKVPDIRRARERLGWVPGVALKDGLSIMIESMKERKKGQHEPVSGRRGNPPDDHRHEGRGVHPPRDKKGDQTGRKARMAARFRFPPRMCQRSL